MASRLWRATMGGVTATQRSCFALPSPSLQFSPTDKKELAVGRTSGRQWLSRWRASLREHLQRANFFPERFQMSTPGAQQVLVTKGIFLLFSPRAKISRLHVWNNRKMTRVNLRCQHFLWLVMTVTIHHIHTSLITHAGTSRYSSSWK